MQFAAKNLSTNRGRKPLQFQVPFSSLPSVELHPISRNDPTFIITPSKEWRYLGFFFDPFLSFSSHVTRYTNKAITTVNNLCILGHLYEGLNPQLQKQVYMLVVWSVMTYGLPLWFQVNGKGIKMLVSKLQTVQNKVAWWITGAFHTSPSAHLEYLAGLSPVIERANVIVQSYMLQAVKVPSSHPLHALASAPTAIPATNHWKIAKRLQSENIWLIKRAIVDIIPFNLTHPQCHIGSHMIDLYPNRFSLIIPDAPPKHI